MKIKHVIKTKTGRLSRFADEIAREEKAQVFAIRIDCSDSRSVREAFEGVLSLGFVEVLVYNAYQPPLPSKPTSFQHLSLHSFQSSLAVSSLGAFHCAQQVLYHTNYKVLMITSYFIIVYYIYYCLIDERRCCREWLKEERAQFSSPAAPLL